VLLVDRVERRMATERQVAAVLLAAGAKDITLPDPDEALAELDRVLAAEPEPEKTDRAVLLDVLGVRSGR
jgi:hypothetical protein